MLHKALGDNELELVLLTVYICQDGPNKGKKETRQAKNQRPVLPCNSKEATSGFYFFLVLPIFGRLAQLARKSPSNGKRGVGSREGQRERERERERQREREEGWRCVCGWGLVNEWPLSWRA